MCRAYNRYMAEVCGRSEGRIEWILVPPLCDLDAAAEEIRFGAANGAVGVFFRGFEKDRTLDDPFFFPVYEEARAQDVAICIHQGSGCPKLDNLGDFQRGQTFISNRLPPWSPSATWWRTRYRRSFPACDGASLKRARPGFPMRCTSCGRSATIP